MLQHAPLYKSPPLLGVLPEIRRDSLGFMRRLLADPAPIVRYKLGTGTSHLVKHPDALKHVLQDNVRNYTKDHFSYSMARWIGGDGLLTSQGDFWLRQRRLAAPAFHRQRIAAMTAMMADATVALLERWDAAPAGSTVQLDAALTELTMTIVGRALFGSNVGPDAQRVSSAFNELSAQLVGRFRAGNPLKPFLPFGADARWNRASAEIHTVVQRIIAQRRRDGGDHGDLLSMFMLATDQETGAQMSDAQLGAEVLTMLLAGHETTATLLTWTFALLAQHPAAESALHAELAAQLSGPPLLEDLARLPYSRMVLDETLRLKPPVYIVSRAVKADDTLCGYQIPAGSSVDISPYVTHRLPEFWERPEAFEPERFAAGKDQERPRFAYFPFLGGPRQCIGMSFALTEAQIVLATIALRYRLTLASPGPISEEPLLTLRPRGGVVVRLERH